ncbi:MAG: hypothetical protein K1000chlam2_01346 [Chlamydiae bacterium]|nr:hypothetical protein [Chlamydiota bacterium]
MIVEGIKLTWIVVKDIEAAIKFYTETVGLTLHQHNSEYGWAELSGPDGSRLGLAQESSEMDVKAGMNAVTAITVKNIETARDFFLEQGVELVGDIIEVPGHVKMQTFHDKDGNMLQIVQKLDV